MILNQFNHLFFFCPVFEDETEAFITSANEPFMASLGSYLGARGLEAFFFTAFDMNQSYEIWPIFSTFTKREIPATPLRLMRNPL